MSEPLNQVQVPTPDGWTGNVFVEIMSAVERDWHETGRGVVHAYFPALRITTYRDRARDKSDGIKYRGRTYHLDEVQYLEDPRGHFQGGWSTDHRTNYTMGYKNDSGSSVSWDSPMRKRLSYLADAVRDAYVADHPEWQRDSQAKRLTWQIRHEEEQAAKFRKEADGHDATAARLRAELDALTSRP